MLSARLVQRIAARPLIRRALDELSSATSQIRVRGAFALMVAWVVLAESLGVELILGAFLAGAIAGLISHDNESAREKLDAIGYGFFIPIFFIMVGVEFDLSILSSLPRGASADSASYHHGVCRQDYSLPAVPGKIHLAASPGKRGPALISALIDHCSLSNRPEPRRYQCGSQRRYHPARHHHGKHLSLWFQPPLPARI